MFKDREISEFTVLEEIFNNIDTAIAEDHPYYSSAVIKYFNNFYWKGSHRFVSRHMHFQKFSKVIWNVIHSLLYAQIDNDVRDVPIWLLTSILNIPDLAHYPIC